jgi:hypothetical protein
VISSTTAATATPLSSVALILVVLLSAEPDISAVSPALRTCCTASPSRPRDASVTSEDTTLYVTDANPVEPSALMLAPAEGGTTRDT